MPPLPRKSQESIVSESDSGVGHDSECSSRIASVEGHPGITNERVPGEALNYSWMVEECILAAYGDKSVKCPSHGDISLIEVAPDAVRFIVHLVFVELSSKSWKKDYFSGRNSDNLVSSTSVSIVMC